MKCNSILIGCIFFLLMVILLGCGRQKATALVNTLTFNTGDFESLGLDYDADDIRVLESDNDKVILKEYMNEDKKSYYARSSIHNGKLLITEGHRPRRSSFVAYIEIYIPQDYLGNLSLHSTSGTIISDIALNLSGTFSVDTTSGVVEVSHTKAAKLIATSTNGSLNIDSIDADEVSIQTTNAKTSLKQINGAMSYQSRGGVLIASDLSGSGSFNASGEGSINIAFVEVRADISAYSKNGGVTVSLPNELTFSFSATTREGSIDTSFADQITVIDNTATGIIGLSPVISIELETRNGDIKVSR